MSSAVMMIGTALTGGAGAVTAATAASVGATVLGSAISGAATAWSAARAAKEERKAEKEAREEEERLKRERYEGIADAADFWNNPTAQGLGNPPANPALGIVGGIERRGQVGRQTERVGRRPDQVGQQAISKIKAQSGNAPRKPKYSYSPETGMIEYAS